MYLEKLSWSQAVTKCVSVGGRLVVVPDEATQNLIVKLQSGRQLWLGASDERVEGRWEWVDGTPVKYSAWQPGQPTGTKRENYMETWKSKGEWIDASENDSNVVGFICEWPAR